MPYRALLTEREREVLAGEAEVSPNYRHQIRYRVREKIARLEADAELLKEYAPDLADELREALAATFGRDF